MNLHSPLITIALLLASTTSRIAFANEGIAILPGKGVAATRIKQTHEVFVQALNNTLVMNVKSSSQTATPSDKPRQRGSAFSDADLNELQVKVNATTVGEIEYIYPSPDNPKTKKRLTVYSRSGRSMQAMLLDAKESVSGTRPRLPSTGDSSDSGLGSDSGEPGSTRGKDVQRDIAEDKYYPRREGYLRATNQEAEGSVLMADPLNRDADAEIKAFRTLERSIKANKIPAGGTVKGFLSQKPCESCARVIDDFAKAYHVTGTIRYLAKPDEVTALVQEAKLRIPAPEAATREIALIEDSGKVSAKTFRDRKDYSRRILAKKDAWSTMTSSREITAADIEKKSYVPGSGSPDPAVCE